MSAVISREQWLADRKHYIGGSDEAALLGVSPWRTPLDVYLEKTGDAAPFEGNDATYWGTRLEDIVAEEYARRTGNKVRRRNAVLVHPEHDFLRANLDREIVGQKRILECKTAGLRSADSWGEDGSDEVPDYYLPQVAHYMAVTGATGADVAVLIGGQDFRIYHVERDPELERLVLERAVSFWQDHVVPRVAPPPMSAQDVVRLYPADDGNALDATPEIAAAVQQLADVRAQIKALQGDKDDPAQGTEGYLANAVKTFLGSAAILRGPSGKPMATWKAAKEAERFDAKRFQAENPDLAAHYTITVPGSRRFLLK